jgi:hypothetical protein
LPGKRDAKCLPSSDIPAAPGALFAHFPMILSIAAASTGGFMTWGLSRMITCLFIPGTLEAIPRTRMPEHLRRRVPGSLPAALLR